MKVDIIVAAYDGTYLHETLKSCVNQSYRDCIITVVDNNSPNDIKRICDNFPKVRYIRSPDNNGPAGARNYGIKNTSSKYISFIDDDDIMHQDKVMLSMKEFKKNSRIGMTCGNYQILVNRRNLKGPFYKKSPVVNWKTLMRQNLVASGSTTVRRDVIEKIGGFDERFWIGEDYACWLKISESYSIKYIPKVLYYYSWISAPNSSLTKRADIQSKHDENLKIIKSESLERVSDKENE